MMQTRAHSEPVLPVLRALGDEVRLRILRLAFERERSVGELVKILDVSQPDVSHHLRKLREAGLLCGRKEGRNVWYGVHPEPSREATLFLKGLRHAWGVPMNHAEGKATGKEPARHRRGVRSSPRSVDIEDYLL